MLTELGYWWDATNLNAADFGVPQTRIRLFVRASRGLLRGYPPPIPWKGWYASIEDMIPSLPDAEFAPWQLARLPEEYKSFMIGNGTYSSPKEENEPTDTVTGNRNQNTLRAFIVPGGNANSFTVRAGELGGASPRAFVLDGQSNEGDRMTVRHGEDRIFTVSASGEKRPTRAYSGGRVVKLNVQCLGRFQTVPDDYKGLTVKINGNGVPCLLAQKVLETL